MSTIEATVVLAFNGGTPDESEYSYLIKLDDISNNDKTVFTPTDQPVIQAHFSNNITIEDIVPLEGALIPIGDVLRMLETNTLFASRDDDEPTELTLDVVPESNVVSYQGRTGGYTTENLSGGRLKMIGDTALAPFLANITTSYQTSLYRFIPPELSLAEDETYNIIIVFYLSIGE